MKYLVLTISSIDYAKAISLWLCGLIVPKMDTNTKYYNGWIQHPESENVALMFSENDNLLIHPKANATSLVDQIRQAIPEDEATEMENIINSNLGQEIKPINFIPQSVGNNILTQEQAESQGWFNNQNI